MILKTRNAGNRHVRSATFGVDTARVSRWAGLPYVTSGEIVDTTTAASLTAVGRAIRLVSGVIASLCVDVFQGEGPDKREQPNAWQARLFDQPALGLSAFDWRWDVASSLEAVENAYLLKVKDSSGRVVELHPIPVDNVHGAVDKTGRKMFDIWTNDGVWRLTTSEVLHIRGQTVGGGAFGVSRITQHRDPLGSMLAAQKFEGAFFRNNARPDIAILFPQGVTRDQARQWREEWDAQYGGPENAGRPLPLGGGATIQTIPLSMQDAQFVEAKRLSVEDIGRIMDVEPVLLGAIEQNADRTQALELFLRIQLTPRLKRIEHALLADTDLFGAGETGLYPQFEVSDMVFVDAATRSKIEHEQIQDGRRLVDELRAQDGLPPLPPVPADWTQAPGMVPQITPVGGAPNPTVNTDTASPTDAQAARDTQLVAEHAELKTRQRLALVA